MVVEKSTPAAAKAVVRITGKTIVLPVKLAEHPPCPLATFDLPYITFYYNQKLLLYKCGADDFAGAVGRLKEGLAAALVEFYPLAGRLAKDGEGALVVDCDGDSVLGAEVIEAAAEGVAVADLAEGDGDVGVLQELVPYTGVMNLDGVLLRRPLLAVQFTKLKDGIAVGCAFNHAILDGSSTWHFMTSWADLSRGSCPSSPPPFHDRTAARSVRVNLDGVLPASAEAHEKADPNGPPKPLVARVFAFPAAAVSRLKSTTNIALPADGAAKPFSTFQSLSAHAWRAVTRARRLPPDAITCFAVFADCRRRVDPPMPESYFGNLIQAVFTGTAAGMLLSGPPELGAGLLQAAIDAHDAAAIRKRLEEYEEARKMFYYTDAGVNCVAVGSSPRFRVYDVDFGFGRPERVRSGSNNKFDGMMYLYPGRDGGGSIDVELTLDAEAMQNLEKDKGFLNVDVA